MGDRYHMNKTHPERITLRASIEEKQQIKQLAAARHRSVQSYVLDIALGRLPISTLEELHRAIGSQGTSQRPK